LRASLIERPHVAFAGAVYALALQVFYNGPRRDSVLQITAKRRTAAAGRGHRGSQGNRGGAGPLDRATPSNGFDLFSQCLPQDGDTLRGLLTFSAAQNVNAVLPKADRPDSSRMVHAALLAEALQLDMGAWFTPTPANYFSRISKAGIIEALREAKGATALTWSGMKKADLAALAEREITGTGWFPDPLRAPTV